MKITLLQVDKIDEQWIAQGVEKYLARIKNYISLETRTITIPKTIRAKSLDEQKAFEENLILENIKGENLIFLLDENGKDYNSEQWAEFLQKQFNSGGKNLIFIIGGPYGFSEKLKKQFPKIRLSAMTFSHQMIRLLFTEQIYRALTIIKGEKYHH